jgi:aromatic-L-amino-acid/L-tryptophan decarboxylase
VPDLQAHYPLEPSASDMQAMGQDILTRIVEHLDQLSQMPSCGDIEAQALCSELGKEPTPDGETPLKEVLDPLFSDWIPRSFTTPGPGYLGFIPGGGVFTSALADFIATATNRYTGVWKAAPVLLQLESNVLRWFAEWMGMPSTTRGLLTTGGSQANFGAIVSARESLLGEALRDGVLYTSSQTHLCVRKSARLAGILPDRVRVVGVDAKYRMRVDELAETIQADRAEGLKPFFVASSAGTTNTGSIDPISDIADLCTKEGLWHHVDGAYGAFFYLCPDLQPRLAGLPRADSIALDPHKSLFLPYGTGALLVRDGKVLRAAHAATAEYLPEPQGHEEFYEPSQYGPELSRDYRGLRAWLPLKVHGVSAFRAALIEKHELAVSAAKRVAALPGVVMDADPQLSLFAFHLSWTGSDQAAENASTQQMLERVNARGRVMITGCSVAGQFMARVCVLCFRTHAESMDRCVEDIATEVAAAMAEKVA